MLEERYGIVAWSYIDQPFNFHGHTCLAMMCLWGLVGVIWAYWVLPGLMWLIELIPERVRAPLTAVLFAYIMVDATLTIAALDSWFLRQAGYAIEGPIQEFCARFFDDAYMRARFETMGMWTELAHR